MNSRSNSAETRTKIIFRYLGLAIIIIHREQTINRGRSQKKKPEALLPTQPKKKMSCSELSFLHFEIIEDLMSCTVCRLCGPLFA